jgi:phosphohistidine phosphatase
MLSAMDLWLLRHAAAEDRAPSGRDRDRELTEDGLRRATQVGRALARLEPEISAIWSSPFRRAMQTAGEAARGLHFQDSIHETESLAPERDPREILDELDGSDVSGGVLIVGHQPHLGALLGRLVVSGGAEIPLQKGSVARIERTGRRAGTLRALLPPAVLERLAAGGR